MSASIHITSRRLTLALVLLAVIWPQAALADGEPLQETECTEGFSFFATCHEAIGSCLPNDGVFEMKLGGSNILVKGRAHGNMDAQVSGSTTVFQAITGVTTAECSAHADLQVNGSTNTFTTALGENVELSGSGNTFTSIDYTTNFTDGGGNTTGPVTGGGAQPAAGGATHLRHRRLRPRRLFGLGRRRRLPHIRRNEGVHQHRARRRRLVVHRW